MKKLIFCLIFSMFFLSLVASSDLQIKVLNEPLFLNNYDTSLVYELEIINNGLNQEFYFYNLLGIDFNVDKTYSISRGETLFLELEIFPRRDFDYKGLHSFNFFAKTSRGDDVLFKLKSKFIDLEDFFSISIENLNKDSDYLRFSIFNKEDYFFENLNLIVNSLFFNENFDLSLSSFEKKFFEIELEDSRIESLTSGFYTLYFDFEYKDLLTRVERSFNFVESQNLIVEKGSSGFFVRNNYIKKINKGNVVESSFIEIDKNIISRLFTSFSPIPQNVNRRGFKVYYYWQEELSPNQELLVNVKTNWYMPFLFLFFGFLVFYFAINYQNQDVIFRKHVKFVRLKGQEGFALKIILKLYSKKYLENVVVKDKLSSFVSFYEKYDDGTPRKIDNSSKSIEWEFLKLERGEIRTLTYVCYSKLGILGKFMLPRAFLKYTLRDKVKKVFSNKTSFISESKA